MPEYIVSARHEQTARLPDGMIMERRVYCSEQTIVSQGTANSELYFINQGRIKVSHLKEQRGIFIKSLSCGQGAGNFFFTPSFWTVSLQR